MNNIFIMALPTLVLVLLKKKLKSLDKINRLKKTMLFVNTFNLVMSFFMLFDVSGWLTYIIFWVLFVGIQKEIFIEAKEKFCDFMVENEGQFVFTPKKINKEDVEGVLTLPEKPNFAVNAKYVGSEKLEINVKYANVKTYLAIDGSGNVFKVCCSN